jgi:hypothetical protein
MDTHIHPDPGSNDSGPLHVSLPEDVLDRERGHSDGDASDAPQSPSVSSNERLLAAEARPRRRRGLLLGTAACVLVLGAGAAYLFSSYNTVYPVPRMASTLRHLASRAGTGQPVLAPSAHLARVNAPPLPAPAMRAPYTPVPKKSEVEEILALRGGAPSTPSVSTLSPAAPALPAPHADSAVPTYLPGEPGGPTISSNPAMIAPQQPAVIAPTPEIVPPAPASKPDLTRSIVAGMRDHDAPPQVAGMGAPAASPEAAQPVSPAAPGQHRVALTPPEPSQALPQPGTTAANSPATNAATAATSLQAAPMSTPEQVQVLELVTRLGTLMADQRKEVDQLRADLARSRVDDTARIDDFQRRLTFAEAQRALAKVTGTPAEPAPPTTVLPAADQASSVVRPTLVVARSAVPADPSQAPAQRYRVQAASPGLAMLAAIDRAGDESAQLQVALGDTVPGYGRVKAVVQQGTTWIVKTERGSIGQ